MEEENINKAHNIETKFDKKIDDRLTELDRQGRNIDGNLKNYKI